MPPDRARALGQRFLVDTEVVRRLVEEARIRPGETVLDVGAGDGAIARVLAPRVAPGGKVVAVEIDPALVGRLRKASIPGVEVVEGDALAVPLPERVDAVVANPPFRPTARILRRLLQHGFGRAALVVPEELAVRLLAEPGTRDYGRLTVEVALRASCRRIFDVAPRAFRPRPDVPCAAVRIDPLPGRVLLDEAVLDAVLESAWESRSRTLRHGLGTLAARLGVSSGDVTEALRATGTEKRTPPEVAPAEWAEITLRIARRAPPRAGRRG